MSSFSQCGIGGNHFIAGAAELASQHLYKQPDMELSEPDCSHDDRNACNMESPHIISSMPSCLQ